MLLGWISSPPELRGLVGAFNARPHVHFGWSLVSSVVSILSGLVAAFYPLAGVFALAIVISAWLIVDGVSSLMIALDMRRAGQRSWGWPALSAIVDWLLAAAFVRPGGRPLDCGRRRRDQLGVRRRGAADARRGGAASLLTAIATAAALAGSPNALAGSR